MNTRRPTADDCVECGSPHGVRLDKWSAPICASCRTTRDQQYAQSYQHAGGLRETQTWADHLRREAREADAHEPPEPKLPWTPPKKK